jgi:hypothetical protein
MDEAPHRLKSSFYVGGQEQFYLEGQISYAIPKEDGAVHLHCSTQHPSEMQHLVAHALGVASHAVHVECRRMGGGFGGKESQSALFACVAGAMLALWLRYNGPDTSLSFEIMMDCLLIVVIGGMGTIYGAAIGSVLFLIAQSYLQDLLRVASEAAHGLPWLAALLSPDRWLLWLGLLFVLSVYYFPTGVVGRLRFPRAKA